ELANLAHDAFAEPGVRRQPLIEVRDLIAQVFLLQLEQGFRIAALDARDEQREEPFEEIRQAAEHASSGTAEIRRAQRSENGAARVAKQGEARPCAGQRPRSTGESIGGRLLDSPA